MSKNLAIFTSQLGTISETFIRRHIEELLPGRTVAVVRFSSHPIGETWTPSCPVLSLDHLDRRLLVRIVRRTGVPGESLRHFALQRFLSQNRTSVVLGEYLDQFIEFVPLLERLGLLYVVQGHGIDLSAALQQPGMARRYLAYKSAAAILTRCEFHRQRLIKLGLPASKVCVNQGGVDVPDFSPRRDSGARVRFLAVGRMTIKKGPFYLLEAFRLAAEKDQDISLDYVGEGELLPAVRQYINACGLGARVRLHGAASTEVKHRLFAQCGVFVQHSVTNPDNGDEEGLPAAIQEAMAHGMAVLSTRHSGIPEAVEDGETGWLVDEGDVAGMAKAMSRIASDSGTCLRFGGAGRAKAQRQYTWTAERSRLLQYLRISASETSDLARSVVA